MHIPHRLLEGFDAPATAAGPFAVEEALQHRRVDVAGANRIHANAFRPMIAGHGAGQRVHRALGRAIRGESGVGDETVVRPEIDEAGAASRLCGVAHQRQRVFRGQERARGIDCEAAIPLVQRRFLDRLFDLYSGGVHKYVELASFVANLLHGRNDIGFPRHIKLDENTAVVDMRRKRPLRSQIGGVDLGPFLQEASDNRPPDASSCSGNQSRFAFKHHPLISFKGGKR